MLVKIIYVADADRRGPDTTRIGKVEDIPDELAQRMVQDGTAVRPTAEEVEAYEAEAGIDPVQRAEERLAEARAAYEAQKAQAERELAELEQAVTAAKQKRDGDGPAADEPQDDAPTGDAGQPEPADPGASKPRKAAAKQQPAADA